MRVCSQRLLTSFWDIRGFTVGEEIPPAMALLRKPCQERCDVEQDFLCCVLPPLYSVLWRAGSSTMTAIRAG